MYSLLCALLLNQLVDPGATGYTFLKLGVGVRPVAMGNAFTALSDDGNAVFWNPAGMGIVRSYYLTGMAMNHLHFINYYNLTSAIPVTRFGGLGIGLCYLGANDIEYSERGEVGGQFTNSDMLLNLGYGHDFGRKRTIAFGAAVKVIRSQLHRYSCLGAVADIGVILNPVKYIYLGTVLKNFGSPRRFIEYWEYPPVNFRQGIAFKIPFADNRFALAADYSWYPDVSPTASVGAEFRIRAPQFMESIGQDRISGFSLMAGYQTGYPTGTWSGFSFGFSIELVLVQDLYLDISALFLSYGYLGSSERIAVGINYAPTKEAPRQPSNRRRRSK